MALVQYYSGILTDRIGRRVILVYSQIPAVAFYLVIFYSVAFPSYLLVLLLAWYGTIVINAIQYPAVQAAVADVTSVKDRLSGYTVMRIMANMGIAIGPLVGAYLASMGLQYIFLISAIATVAEVIMLYLLMKETYDPKAHPGEGKHAFRSTYRKDRLFLVFTVVGIVLGFFMRQRGSSFTGGTSPVPLSWLYLGPERFPRCSASVSVSENDDQVWKPHVLERHRFRVLCPEFHPPRQCSHTVAAASFHGSFNRW